MEILLDTKNETLTVDGVTMSLDLVRQLANPDRAMFYKFSRIDADGGAAAAVIICEAFRLEQPGIPLEN